MILSDNWRKYYNIETIIKELELKNKITKIIVEKTNEVLKNINSILAVSINEIIVEIMGELK